MNHTQIKKQNIIEDYLCHRLDAELVDAFEEHLLFCARCRKELQTQEMLIASIQKAAFTTHQNQHNDSGKGKNKRLSAKLSKWDNRIHEPEKSYDKRTDRYRFLRIAAVITLLIISASLLGLFLNQISIQGRLNSGIVQNAVMSFKNFYYWNKNYYLKSMNRLVTDELYDTYHLQEKSCFKGINLLDNLIDDQYRNSKLPIKVRTPAANENIITDLNGRAQLTFNGLCKYPEIVQNERFFLRIFSNNPEDFFNENTLSEAEIHFTAKSKSLYTFKIVEQLKLSQGLYYFTIEERDTDPIFIGKFFVDALN